MTTNLSLYSYYSWVIIVIFAFVFYVIMLVKLHTRRHSSPLDGPYFALWRALAVADLTSELFLWICIKSPLLTGQQDTWLNNASGALPVPVHVYNTCT